MLKLMTCEIVALVYMLLEKQKLIKKTKKKNINVSELMLYAEMISFFSATIVLVLKRQMKLAF